MTKLDYAWAPRPEDKRPVSAADRWLVAIAAAVVGLMGALSFYFF